MMLTRAQAWAWYFDRNPNIAAVWGHQNGRWPMHLTYVPEEEPGGVANIRCGSDQCWCHLETDGGGGDEDAGEGHAGRNGDRDPE
jgi:hypothetical protein